MAVRHSSDIPDTGNLRGLEKVKEKNIKWKEPGADFLLFLPSALHRAATSFLQVTGLWLKQLKCWQGDGLGNGEGEASCKR